MSELLSVVIPLLLIDVLNPVLFAVLIYAASTSRPVLNSSALLAGHTLAYIAVGLVASLGIEKITARLANPQPLDFAIEFLLALACLYAAFSSRGGGASEEKKPEGELTPMSAMAFGAMVNFIGAPFAIPYLAVVDQVLQAELGTAGAIALLVIYNLAYAAPFVLVPLLIATMGERARPLLNRINGWLEKGADLLMPWLMLALGLWLLADVGSFLLTGEPL